MGNAPTTVLVIDDDPDIREVFALLLSAEGYYPLLAEDGETALDHLRSGSWQPELIIVDEVLSGVHGQMPRMTGHEFIAQMEKENLRLMPIILSSAMQSVISECGKYGADACLPKPFEMAEFFNLLKQLLGKRVEQVV